MIEIKTYVPITINARDNDYLVKCTSHIYDYLQSCGMIENINFHVKLISLSPMTYNVTIVNGLIEEQKVQLKNEFTKEHRLIIKVIEGIK